MKEERHYYYAEGEKTKQNNGSQKDLGHREENVTFAGAFQFCGKVVCVM